MTMNKDYAVFAANKAVELLNIDSPTGFTKKASAWVSKAFEEFGYSTKITNKGAVIIDFGGKDSEEGAVLFEAHTDTLGAMVTEVKGDGRLKITRIGGLMACNVETENVNIYTRDGKVYEGTIQLENASSHVNKDLASTERTFDNIEVVIDEMVKDADEVRALGIETGDFVCPNPRAHVTASGFIKSRFLDDKLSVATLLGFAKFIKDEKIELKRHVYAMVTVYEEVGHGGAASIPEGITEAISVDMGCVGNGLNCKEHQVSICAKDSGGPYDYDVTDKLVKAAKKEGADYAIDIYPFYGSDVEATLSAGYDIRHGLIGPGVYASHGYERSHVDGVYATLLVLKGYLGI
ncbi:MAG: M42 family metallopeptidase [Lachnospiraceae bacterium]|nr:M42 family metallopeptidase [Lachnospiraceae bacterium]